MRRRYWLVGGILALVSLGALRFGPAASLGAGGVRPGDPPPGPGRAATLLVPERGAYTGAYIDFGEHEDDVTLEKIDAFASLVGKRQALVAFSNFWGRGHFPASQARIIANAGAIPVVFWNPWDRRDGPGRTQFDLNEIAAGRWDGYIDAWASEARAFGKPLLVAWGLEMNGNWFPWSGALHGGGEPIPGTDPPLHKGPETFKRAYRHVVERARAAGAFNISWLFHVNNASIPRVSWNRMAAYYPGGDTVDWLAMSAYGKQFPTQPWVGVDKAILGPYQELAAVDPSKPILLAEWGIGEFPKAGDKGAWIGEAFKTMERRMPGLKGAVFWHERWQNKDLSYSNLRANSSLPALKAFRKGVSRSFWLAEPRYSATPLASNVDVGAGAGVGSGAVGDD